jgi:meso-butanediol dehydrogenase / (S,S)-butanediol dehydrogenase / diacetyl reductase
MLSSKVIIVTGATSGMGAETAFQLAAQGAKVMLFGRNLSRANDVKSRIKRSGGIAEICIGDVTESSAADNVIEKTISSFGQVDGLVNAAGIIYRGNAEQTGDDDWRASMATNVDGSFFMSRAAVRVMKSGSIVNFASTCGLVGAAGLTAYCVTKGAVVQLTRAMALDHAKQNIRVNSVCPGAIDTPMLVSGHEENVQKDDVFASNVDSIPQGRIPGPEEVASVVVFLCSDLSSHITGTNIPVDGGYTAQ